MATTQTDKTAELLELRTQAESLVKSYNEKLQEGKIDEAMKLDEQATQTVNEYTSIVREMCFEECRMAEDPMLKAVELLSYETIGTKDEKVEGLAVPVRSVIDKERQIDLLKLHSTTNGGIGADKNWSHIAQKVNMLLTAQKCVDLGIDPKTVNDSYSMTEIARGIEMGKTPTSKTNILKTLQSVVEAMLGEGYKATSHDVNFLLSIYSRKNRKALTVSCSNHKNFRNYIAEVCHRIVTGKSYNVEFQKRREGIVTPMQETAKVQKPAKSAKKAA